MHGIAGQGSDLKVGYHTPTMAGPVDTCKRIGRAGAREFLHAYRGCVKQFLGPPEISLEELLGRTPPEPTDAPILEDCFMPPHQGPRDHDDLSPLIAIVATLRPRSVLELGTAYGNTAANVCRFSEAEVVTVNALPEQLDGKWTTCALGRDDIGRVFRRFGYEDRVRQVYSNTQTLEVSDYYDQGGIDVAIIDACHDTGFVVADFLRVAPFVAGGGLVLVHDAHPSMAGHLSGGYVACMKLRRRGYDLRHLDGTWWGVWRAPALGR